MVCLMSRQGLDIDISMANASQEDDKIRILNCIRLPHARTKAGLGLHGLGSVAWALQITRHLNWIHPVLMPSSDRFTSKNLSFENGPFIVIIYLSNMVTVNGHVGLLKDISGNHTALPMICQ